MLISGPISFYLFYDKKLDHFIYLFGDEHENLHSLCKPDYQSTNIWDLFENLINKNKDVLFNIFIEMYHEKINPENMLFNYPNIDVIYKLVEKFIKKPNNSDNNFMVHYVDYRVTSLHSFKQYGNIDERYKISLKFFNMVEELDYNLYNIILNKNNQHVKKVKKIIEFFIENDLTTIKKYIDYLKKCIKFSKINKQLDNIKESYIIDAIYQYENDFLKKTELMFKNFDLQKIYNTIIEKEINFKTFKEYNNIINLWEFNFICQNIIMDLYTLGRIMRFYKENDKFKGSKYSIIYAGHAHILSYKDFFQKKLNFKLLYSFKKHKTKRCIYIDDLAFKNLNL